MRTTMSYKQIEKLMNEVIFNHKGHTAEWKSVVGEDDIKVYPCVGTTLFNVSALGSFTEALGLSSVCSIREGNICLRIF